LLLESLQKHIPLSEQDKALICETVRERKVKKNQYLVHEGAVQRCTNFVNKGSVRTYYIAPDAQEHIVQFAIEGWWISDLQSFIMQLPATFNVQAIEDSEILEISFENMELLYEKIPKMERYFRIITQRAFVSFQQRVIQNISMTAEERYLAFQAKHPQMELRIPQKLIASYVGISAEFLSKIRKRLAQKSDLKR
ncbi:MAG TPA: Crp/Fnr family transcriptional regulator, partial [Chitinophagales bacterium]|nr:Crp/Fnr family transcriptional regulator [Chitinophagales bacterium]